MAIEFQQYDLPSGRKVKVPARLGPRARFTLNSSAVTTQVRGMDADGNPAIYATPNLPMLQFHLIIQSLLHPKAQFLNEDGEEIARNEYDLSENEEYSEDFLWLGPRMLEDFGGELKKIRESADPNSKKSAKPAK